MDPNQVTQVFQRCPGCRAGVSPADAACPSCGRSLADAIDRTMPLPRPDPGPAAAAQAPPNGWVVANTGGEGVFLRRTPRLEDRLIAWPDGTPLQDLGEEATGEVLTWRKVRDPGGNVGYVPTKWLAPKA